MTVVGNVLPTAKCVLLRHASNVTQGFMRTMMLVSVVENTVFRVMETTAMNVWMGSSLQVVYAKHAKTTVITVPLRLSVLDVDMGSG